MDEFQDTNRLQNELLGLLARDNLFRVGDENQSIYRFRNADVGVFRGHWERGALRRPRREHHRELPLARGDPRRDRPRLRAHLGRALRAAPRGARLARAGGRGVAARRAARRGRGRDAWKELTEAGDPFGAGLEGAPPWRAAEARLLAKRIDELTRGGPWSYGDVVILFRATTAMGLFERALDERGIPVHVVGGRGYWGQQQVADLRHWLAALANPLDGLALFSVLASPLAGMSVDAVALVALHARRSRRDPWWTLRDGGAELLELLPEADRPKLRAFVARFEAERRIAGQVSLETLIDRAVTLTGYDRHLLALPGGTRRMANVRKLMRMAREFEADQGRDLRGFIDAVAERDLIQAREGEAPLEAEALDAVRMMTVHRAKGLEFPVVCVADLGKDGRDDDGRLRISDDGSVGLRLASLGGGAVDSANLAKIKAEGKVAAEEEERRIFYVAVTRAQRQLVLSGATDLTKRQDPVELQEPMRWIWRGFCAGLPSEGATGIETDEREGRPVAVRWTRLTAATRRRAAAARRPRAGRPRARAGAGLRAAAARAGHAARAARARGEPAELFGPRGLPALRLPLLPRADAPDGAGGAAPVRRRAFHRHRSAAARERRPRDHRATRLRASRPAGGGRGGSASRAARRGRRPGRGRGHPRPRRKAGRLRAPRAPRPVRGGSAPSCPSRSRSPRPAPAGAACS